MSSSRSGQTITPPATTPRRAPCSRRTPTTAPARSSARAGWPSAARGTRDPPPQEKPLSFWERGWGEGHSHAGVSRPATTPLRAPCSHRTPTTAPARSSARGCWPSATRGTRDPLPQEKPLPRSRGEGAKSFCCTAAGLSAARRPLLYVRRVAIEHPRRPRLEVLHAAVGRLPHAERATHLRKKSPSPEVEGKGRSRFAAQPQGYQPPGDHSSTCAV